MCTFEFMRMKKWKAFLIFCMFCVDAQNIWLVVLTRNWSILLRIIRNFAERTISMRALKYLLLRTWESNFWVFMSSNPHRKAETYDTRKSSRAILIWIPSYYAQFIIGRCVWRCTKMVDWKRVLSFHVFDASTKTCTYGTRVESVNITLNPLKLCTIDHLNVRMWSSKYDEVKVSFCSFRIFEPAQRLGRVVMESSRAIFVRTTSKFPQQST